MQSSESRPKIALIYIDSGGGHRAAANALIEVARQQGLPWDIEMLGVQQLLDSIDFIRKSTGIPFQDVYNIMLRRGWTLGSAHLIPVMHRVIRASHRSQVAAFEEQWRRSRPDMVVSLIPHYNRAMRESLDRAWPGTPYVTILTDIADYPPHFWIEPVDQHVICGSQRAVIQARMIGIPEERILRTSGMILNPRFYEPLHLDVAGERARLGLHPDLPTGVVLFGGEGSVEMVRIAKALNRAGSDLQLILLCGKHEEVAAELRAIERNIPMHVQGFTQDIPHFMELADFFIGKPGPGSISEAVAKRLPVIVQRNAWTLAHERYNADWVEEQGVGLVVDSFSHIAEAVDTMLVPENYERFRTRAAAIRNFAVYEIPAMLNRILEESKPPLEDSYSGRSLPSVARSA